MTDHNHIDEALRSAGGSIYLAAEIELPDPDDHDLDDPTGMTLAAWERLYEAVRGVGMVLTDAVVKEEV